MCILSRDKRVSNRCIEIVSYLYRPRCAVRRPGAQHFFTGSGPAESCAMLNEQYPQSARCVSVRSRRNSSPGEREMNAKAQRRQALKKRKCGSEYSECLGFLLRHFFACLQLGVLAAWRSFLFNRRATQLRIWSNPTDIIADALERRNSKSLRSDNRDRLRGGRLHFSKASAALSP
jgi:hypothetical protein